MSFHSVCALIRDSVCSPTCSAHIMGRLDETTSDDHELPPPCSAPPCSAKGVLPRGRRFAYGVGHVLNDLCASMWFTYLLLYLHHVVEFNNVLAGNLLLLGQVMDALATPFVGLESDRLAGCWGYGKRKSWHLAGTVCVLCSFAFIFIPCPTCSSGQVEDWAKFLYYAPFVVIFQFGWAATQISHLALITDLTPVQSERVELNAIRYAFTVCSSLVVYVLAWALLSQTHTGSPEDDVTPQDSQVFTYLVIIVVSIGFVFSVIFHVGTRENAVLVPTANGDLESSAISRTSSPPPVQLPPCRRLVASPDLNRPHESRASAVRSSAVRSTTSVSRSSSSVNIIASEVKKPSNSVNNTISVSSSLQAPQNTWRCWLKLPQFYVNGMLYMCTRLIVNLTQVYLGMYLLETLSLDKSFIAIIPLVTYVSGFVSTIGLKPINKLLGGKLSYCVGLAFSAGACVWFYFLHDDTPALIYKLVAAAVLSGIGGAFILVTALALTADLIGRSTTSGAFVYGAMSFADKLSNGLAIQIIQILHPCKMEACCSLCGPFYRTVLVFVPGACIVLAFLTLFVVRPAKPGEIVLRKESAADFYETPDEDDGTGCRDTNEADEERKPLLDTTHNNYRS